MNKLSDEQIEEVLNFYEAIPQRLRSEKPFEAKHIVNHWEVVFYPGWGTRGDSFDLFEDPDENTARFHAHAANHYSDALRELQELRKEIEYFKLNGCLTGDCPHEHANDCLVAIIEAAKELGK